MVRDYELMYIVRPDLDDDSLRSTVKNVRGLIEAQGGEIVKTTLWGKRRLAYEVQRLRDGHYVLVALRLDGDRVREVERALRISDAVFRHLLVRHEGPMPEPEEEIEEKPLPGAGDLTAEDASGAGEEEDVGISSARADDDETDYLDEDTSSDEGGE